MRADRSGGSGRGRGRGARRGALLAAGLAALLAGVTLVLAGPRDGAAAAGRGKPNLGVAGILAVPHEVESGATFAVKVMVDNLGKARARSSRVSLHLSRDTTKGGGDLPVGGAPVPGMDPWQVRTVTGRITVPGSARGSYFVIACADAGRKVAESRERDNCSASQEKVRIIHPVHGLLVGTLDLYDSGQEDGPVWHHLWERYAQAQITMSVTGLPDDLRVVDDGSGYSWLGESTTTIDDPDCPTTTKEDEQMVGLFQYGSQAVSDLRGTSRDPDLSRLRLSAQMEYDVTGSVTSCDGTRPYTDTTEYLTLLDLAEVSRSEEKITYSVTGSWVGPDQPAQWDSVEGTLELRLD
jgi:hypothetical protein